MTREKPVRRAKAKRVRITAAIRREIHRLANTGMTMFEIAQVTGVRNQGRVSDVLAGRR